MRLESDDARCDVDPRHVVNLHDYPEALHDPCGQVVCDACHPCPCGKDQP